MTLQFIIDLFSDICFPPRCVCCDKVLLIGQVCECMNEMEKLKLKVPLLDLKANKQEDTYITAAFALYTYEGKVKQAIKQFKFRKNMHHGTFFGIKMVEVYKEYADFINADVVIPVPLSILGRIRRGYNQSGLLAEEISQKMGILLRSHALLKLETAKPQRKVGKAKRKGNVLGVYSVVPIVNVKDKNILLIDDVITTGSTVNECAKMLLLHGAKNVFLFCIATTPYKKKKEGK